VGSNLAARLVDGGTAEVSVVARGPHLGAIRARGLTVHTPGRVFSVRPAFATDEPESLPGQDVVVVTLKAPSIPAHAAALARLIRSDGFVVFFGNGIPWWWNYGLRDEPTTLPLLDPDGSLWTTLGPQRVLGGVVYSSNELEAPGIVRNRAHNRWIVGEPAGGSTHRLELMRSLYEPSTAHLEITGDIRDAIWEKLLVNAAVSGVSGLTRLTTELCARDDDLARIMTALVEETLRTAAAIGWDLSDRVDPAVTIAAFLATPGVHSSLLQDVLRNRPAEVEAILGQVHAFAEEAGVETPMMDVVLPLLRGLDRGRFPGARE
jgi:2-dehydropantoate 2-reductase